MASTVHRQVNFVNTPDIEYQFFNHINWNGLCTNQNYFNVDQETFEDCKNVYIDNYNVLKSRPAFKSTGDLLTNMWVFDNIVVTYNVTPGTKWLNFNTSFPKPGGGETYTYYITDDNFKLLPYDDKIFIITNDTIKYYKNGEVKDATDYIYVPEVEVYTDNVLSTEQVETANIFTGSIKKVYNYTDATQIDFVKFTEGGDSVSLTIGGEKYNDVKITEDLDKVIVTKGAYVPNSCFADKYCLGPYNEGRPLIFIAKNETGAIRCDLHGEGSFTYTIYHTTNFLTWKFIDTVTDATMPPFISENGEFVAYLSYGTLKIKSLLQSQISTGVFGYKYVDWTELITDNTYIAGLSNFGYKPTTVTTWDRNTTCMVKLIDDKNYTIVCGTYVEGADEPFVHTYVNTYDRLYVLNCKDGVVDINNYSNKLTSYVLSQIDFDLYSNYFANGLLVYNMDILNSSINSNFNIIKMSVSNGVTAANVFTGGIILNLLDDTVKFTDDAVYFASNGKYNGLVKIEQYALRAGISISDEHIQVTEHAFGLNNLISNNMEIITEKSYYNNITLENETTLLQSNVVPVAYGNYFYYVYNNHLYTQGLRNVLLTAKVTIPGASTPIVFDNYTELSSTYISKDNVLYISDGRYNDDGEKLLYFPKINVEQFSSNITYLYPISTTQAGIFFDNKLKYVEYTENGYTYYDSKIKLGCKKGSNVISSPDGSSIIFSTERGLVYMSYQDYISSTDQALTFLSNNIYERYKDFAKSYVKLTLQDNWIICYNDYNTEMFIFDIRNNSWWPWETSTTFKNILKYDDILYFVSNDKVLITLHKNNDDYYDKITVAEPIKWYIVSQKLHLGTLNYYKNVLSLTLNNVQTKLLDKSVTCRLSIKNYRINVDELYDDEQVLDYDVNLLRTYVKRCNSKKVNEFQYTIKDNVDGEINPYPLSLNSIVIKYTVGGQIR